MGLHTTTLTNRIQTLCHHNSQPRCCSILQFNRDPQARVDGHNADVEPLAAARLVHPSLAQLLVAALNAVAGIGDVALHVVKLLPLVSTMMDTSRNT